MTTTTGKDAYYFKHDANARSDPKIMAMRSVYKAEGYGWYWMIVEILREQSTYTLTVDEFTWSTLAMQLHCDSDVVERFVKDCATRFRDEAGPLLHLEDGKIWSESLIRRMESFDEQRPKKQYAAHVRWHGEDAGALQMQSGSNADAEQVHSGCNAKRDKRREDKIREDKRRDEKKGKSDFYASKLSLPLQFQTGEFEKEWNNWVDFRFEDKKKPLTDRAVKSQIDFLVSQTNPLSCLRTAVRCQWQGLYRVKDEVDYGTKSAINPNRTERDEKLAALLGTEGEGVRNTEKVSTGNPGQLPSKTGDGNGL